MTEETSSEKTTNVGGETDGVALVAEDLGVSFGDVTVLDGVDFRADPGTLVGLVGPNGAGKTTLIRTLKGTLAPDSGTIRVGDEDLAGLSSRETSRRIGSVPQDTTLTFGFTVEQVVEMGRTPHLPRFGGLDAEDRTVVDRAMDRTETTQFADRSITEVSGGERQRVLLARALAQETPVLLLDEPTGSLDINHAIRTLELLRDLVADGHTAVAAIHDLNLAARYCDELVLLSDGGVRASGPPDRVLTRSTLRDAFDARTIVTDQPAAAAPLVTPLPDRPENGADGVRVHVVGAGDRASTAVSRLAAAGHAVSLGVTPAGDVAAETAREVGAQVVLVPAFRGVNDDAARAARELAAAADVALVVGEPAPGNEAVATAADRRILVGCRSLDGTEARLGELPDVIEDVAAE